jgi:hypothetical protein
MKHFPMAKAHAAPAEASAWARRDRRAPLGAARKFPASPKERPALLFGLFAVGLWLTLIGAVAIASGKWPIYLTLMQLDALHVLVSPLGERVATYVVGAFAGVLGLSICVACGFVWKRLRA